MPSLSQAGLSYAYSNSTSPSKMSIVQLLHNVIVVGHGHRNTGSVLQQHSSFQRCTVVKMRRGLFAMVIDQTNSMADVYGAFFYFACMLKPKVDKTDPNATKTLSRIEAIQKICRDSGTLNKRKLYILKGKSVITPAVIFAIFIILAVILSRLFFQPAK